MFILYLLAGLALLIIGLLLVAAFRRSEFRIARSIQINASANRIFPNLNDLRAFQEWSPFRDKDPNARNEWSAQTEGPGASFSWDGNSNVGSGRMTITDSVPDRLVCVDLEFFKPYVGRNKVEFQVDPAPPGHTVTWTISGQYAFMPRLIGLFINMERMIGNDFEIGLQRLKSLVESKAT